MRTEGGGVRRQGWMDESECREDGPGGGGGEGGGQYYNFISMESWSQ